MSLVGSLEDLGLGDILQIVSLARKSGCLFLRTNSGEGRIVFELGLVRVAQVKGAPETLRGLVAARGLGEAASLERVCAQAQAEKWPQHQLDERVAECCGISLEQLHGLRREHLEQAVFQMFRWRVGEFSFDVCDELSVSEGELSVEVGVNAQYLTMEATRLGDESGDAAPEPAVVREASDEDALRLSGEEEVAGVLSPPADAHETLALATASSLAADPEVAGTVEPERPPASPPAGPLVVIDAELRALEWLKGKLAQLFSRVHIFQHSEGGVARIRQYLGRGEVPVVLVSSRVPADSLTGSLEAGELLRRLRAQAPRMPILAMYDGDEERPPRGVDAADAVVKRPSLRLLADDRRRAESERMAEELCRALAPWSAREADAEVSAPEARAKSERLQAISDRLRDPATRGELLELVLDFGAECFRRVAMFMVRDDEAIGIAQRGLAAAGGPDDKGIREVRIGLREPAWFRAVIDGSGPACAAPSDAGDAALAARLGGAAPREAYVGAIESGGRLAALLYADNLPAAAACGSVDALDSVLHEAGLALDRALLERAPEAAESLTR